MPPAPSETLAARFAWIMRAGWIDAAGAQKNFDKQFERDRLGHTCYSWTAFAMLIIACMPATFSAIAIGFLIGYWIFRLYRTRQTACLPFALPLTIALTAFAAWMAISVSWSLDPHHGWNEFSKLRWLAFVLLLWPVMDRRNLLIAAICIGCLLGNLSQVAEAIGRHFDIYNVLTPFTGKNIEWMRDPDRTGGWWHPLAAGSILVAVLGLHLPAAIMGTGRPRMIALCGSAISLVGIVATGTRGAVIASVPLVLIVFAVAVFRVRPSKKTLGFAALALAVAACIGMMTLGDRVITRIDRAWQEVTTAIEGKNYASDNGARVQMAIWALDALKAHPLTGIGAGGYEEYCARRVKETGKEPTRKEGDDPAKIRIFEHAHNSILHIAATTGLVGVAFAGLIVLTSLWGAFAPLSREQWGTYAAGPGFALIGMYLVSMTDPVHFNTQTGILLAILLALCPVWRPGAKP